MIGNHVAVGFLENSLLGQDLPLSSSSNYDLKEQVRAAIDIVDLVGSYLDLRREGRNYTALCPWHPDSRPSLKVNPDRQSWKCWVCDDGGDIFNFVQKKEGVGFVEALELLAERAGIPFQQGPQAAEGTAAHKPTLFRVIAWAEQQFHRCLQHDPAAQVARDYLRDRGINEESVRQFHLGYAPAAWDWLIRQAEQTPFSVAVLEAAGLVTTSQQRDRRYDRFRDRLLFSIRDAQNRPIAFGGRVLPGSTEAAKYINSPETRLFSKSDHLYGIELAREAIVRDRHAVIVEGYTDVIMAHQWDVRNVVAVLGTALGPRHIRLLRRFADRVTLVLDGDEAGQKRTNEVLELFVASPLDLRIVTLPDGSDPCDFVAERGADAFRDLIDQAADALTYKINLAVTQAGTMDSLHRSNQALEEILQTLAGAAANQKDASNPWQLRMQQVIGRLAREFRVDETALRERLRQLTRNKQPLTEQVELAPARTELAPFDLWDRELFRIMFRHPEFVPILLEKIDESLLATEPAKQIWRIYNEVCQADQEPDFCRILTAIEDSTLKSKVVEIDEARISSPAEPQDCLEQLIEAYHAREAKGVCRDKVAELESSVMTEDEQIDALAEVLNRQRKRHGISAPTEG